jgi:hypothetical protein
LTKTSGRVEQAAALIGKALGDRRDALAPPAALPGGWACAASLSAAAAGWDTFVHSLAGSVSSFGTDLAAAATQYRATDGAAGDRVDRAGGR